MNCQNCGAPLRPVPDRDYLYCDYCATFYFPEPNRDGVKILEDAGDIAQPGKVDCPVCKDRLLQASVDQYPVLYCQKCQGVLTQRLAFTLLVRYLRLQTNEPETKPRPLDPSQLERRLICPSCARPMETHPYYGPGNVIIDTCQSCNLIWLDYGELYRIVNSARYDRKPWPIVFDPGSE